MTKKEKPLFRGYKISILVACELVLAFSGIGYIAPFGSSAAMLYIPVIAAAYFYGCGAGMLLGAVFGFTSIVKSSMSVETVGYFNTLFSPFLSGDVIGSLCVALGARIAFGLTAGVLFAIAKRFRINEYIKVAVIATVSHILHSVFVLLPMGYFFTELHINVSNITDKIFSVRELVLDSVIVVILFVIIYISKIKKFAAIQKILKESMQAYYFKRVKNETVAVVLFLFFVVIILLSHFYIKISSLINISDIEVTFHTKMMLINLQCQFLMGIVAIWYIVALLIISYRLYSYYQINNSNKDGMTGLYNKATAMEYGSKVMNRKMFPNTYFVILDIDNFKSINDTYGHSIGDRTIVNIARLLEMYFGASGFVARFGGDEFAVFVTRNLDKRDIEKRIKDFQSDVATMSFSDNKEVTCSIGIIHISNEKNFEEVYNKADEMLYQVKIAGKNGYKFYESVS